MKQSIFMRGSLATASALAVVLALGVGNASAGDKQGAQSSSSMGAPSQQHLRAAQEKLNKQGYDAGRADGHWGARTASAVRRFQQDKGIAPSGQLDAATMAALDNAAAGSTRSTTGGALMGGRSDGITNNSGVPSKEPGPGRTKADETRPPARSGD